jgi:GAF domain-containing protein
MLDPAVSARHDEAADPVSDLGRLLEVASYDFALPEVRARLHELAQQAATALGQPVGLVTIVLDSAQYLAGMYGVEGWMAEVEGTPVEWSFCAHAVRSGQPYVVEDALTDPEHADNPLVTVDHVRSYAGAPIFGADGHVLGAVCALGPDPHHFARADLETLEHLAADAVDELNHHRLDGEPAA